MTPETVMIWSTIAIFGGGILSWFLDKATYWFDNWVAAEICDSLSTIFGGIAVIGFLFLISSGCWAAQIMEHR